MDTLSHGLYAGVAVGRASKKEYTFAFLMGVAPDILVFGTFIALGLLGFIDAPRMGGRPDIADIPPFVFRLYDITHSLIVYAGIFAALWFIGKWQLARLSLGWPLHILVDIPTHTTEFFPTPFLWPIADTRFDGVSWSTPWIFIPNVLIIVGLYLWWFISSRKRTTSH